MTMLTDTDIGSGSLRFAKDYIGADYHNDGDTHIDALCHVAYEGSLYNGRPQDSFDAEGATVDSIDVLKNGLVGRGVLLDIPPSAASGGSSQASTFRATTFRRPSQRRASRWMKETFS